MVTFLRRLVLVFGLGSGLVLPAVAQTARIAHFSHSGSLATLASAESLDNFGIVPDRFDIDSIVAVSDTTAIKYGKMVPWHERKDSRMRMVQDSFKYASSNWSSRKERIQQLKNQNPEAKFIGFNKFKPQSPRKNKKPVPAADTAKKPKIPVSKPAKTQRLFGGGMVDTDPPQPPQHPGVWLAVALIVTLGGAGWLLGAKEAQPPLAQADA